MRVVVASGNPVKLNAVREAFGSQFPKAPIELISANVSSGVSDQPSTDEETLYGARNRAAASAAAVPDAEFWVGLEGGTQAVDDYLMAFAWMAIRGPRGDVSESRTVTLPLPPKVRDLVEQGLELGEANDRIFSTINSKQKGGAYGLLTGGLYTRESVYTQALIIALIPFVHELYPTATTSGQT